MAADGSVELSVRMNTAQAEKDLAKLKNQIQKAEATLSANESKNAEKLARLKTSIAKLEDEISRKQAKRAAAEQEFINQEAALDDLKKDVMLGTQDRDNAKGDERKRLNTLLNEYKDNLKGQQSNVNEARKEWENISKEIDKSYSNLAKLKDAASDLEAEMSKTDAVENLENMKEQAGELEQQIEKMRPAERLADEFETAQKKMTKFIRYALGIRSVYLLFQKLKRSIKDAVVTFAESDKETSDNIKMLKNELNTLKVSFGAAFAPILNAIAPILQKLIEWLNSAANAAAKFFAIISGRTSYKRAVANNNNLADSLGGVADSAKEANKQLAGFDELNVLSESNSSSGGGSSGSKGYDVVEEAIDAVNTSFLSNLALSIRDVFFTWNNLNPEVISEKLIVGLTALLGGALGVTAGLGVGGIMLSVAAGITIGLIADALIFDHDGTLSEKEVVDMVCVALGAIIGGVIGFSFGGPAGAIVGASLGIGFTLLVKGLNFKADGEESKVMNKIKTALNIIVGAGIGFVLGGPAGAAIGAFLTFGITLGLKSVMVRNDGDEPAIINKIKTAMNVIIGTGIGFVLGGPAGAVIGMTLSFGISLALKGISVLADDKKAALEEFMSNLRSAITAFVGGAIVFKAAIAGGMALGPAGIVAGITLGVIFTLTKATLTKGDDLEETTKESWIEKIKNYLNFPDGDDFKANFKKWFWDDGILAELKELYALITGNDFDDSKNLGEQIVEQFKEALDLSTIAQDALNALKKIFEDFTFPHIKLPHIKIEWTKIGGVAGVIASKFGISETPSFSVDWYAKGGIFDKASMIGVGENGREAVLPLENNTGWLTEIADMLAERLASNSFVDQFADAIANVPYPAMANGSIIPPNSTSIEGSLAGISSALTDLKNLLNGRNGYAGGNDSISLQIDLDGATVARKLYRYNKQVANEHGTSLVNS